MELERAAEEVVERVKDSPNYDRWWTEERVRCFLEADSAGGFLCD